MLLDISSLTGHRAADPRQRSPLDVLPQDVNHQYSSGHRQRRQRSNNSPYFRIATFTHIDLGRGKRQSSTEPGQHPGNQQDLPVFGRRYQHPRCGPYRRGQHNGVLAANFMHQRKGHQTSEQCSEWWNGTDPGGNVFAR